MTQSIESLPALPAKTGRSEGNTMTDHTLGEIRIFPFDSLPKGWVPCDGQVLPIDNVNMVLFALIGSTFGGDGQHNFALPDLRGKVPIGPIEPGERGKSVPSPSNEAGPKETQPTVALLYAICVDGIFPSID